MIDHTHRKKRRKLARMSCDHMTSCDSHMTDLFRTIAEFIMIRSL